MPANGFINAYSPIHEIMIHEIIGDRNCLIVQLCLTAYMGEILCSGSICMSPLSDENECLTLRLMSINENLVTMLRKKLIKNSQRFLGMSGWLRQLSIRLLASAQGMIESQVADPMLSTESA